MVTQEAAAQPMAGGVPRPSFGRIAWVGLIAIVASVIATLVTRAVLLALFDFPACAGYFRHPFMYFILVVDILTCRLTFAWLFIPLDETGSRHRISKLESCDKVAEGWLARSIQPHSS